MTLSRPRRYWGLPLLVVGGAGCGGDVGIGAGARGCGGAGTCGVVVVSPVVVADKDGMNE